MKKYIINVLKYSVVFISLILIFILLLVISSSFSSEHIKENVTESSQILLAQHNKMYIPLRYRKVPFDNYTDALMVNTAYSIDSNTPLYSAFTAKKNYIPGITDIIYEDTSDELVSSSKYPNYLSQVEELYDLANGYKNEAFEYGRYWHGYLVFLRPILLFFNISQLRHLLTIVLYVLAAVLVILITRKINWKVSLFYLLCLIGVDYFMIGNSIQGVWIFLISMIASIILLIRKKNVKNIGIYFFVIGMVTNFLDFLTNPILTLGIPISIYFLILQKENKYTLKKYFFEILKICISWFLGYALTWLSKWVLIDIIYNKDIIHTAIHQIFYRSSAKLEKATFADNIYVNAIFALDLILLTFIIFSFIAFTNLFKMIVKRDFRIKERLTGSFVYIVITFMPIVWYFVVRNHTYYHNFFTYRMLMLVCLGILLSSYKFFCLRKEK